MSWLWKPMISSKLKLHKESWMWKPLRSCKWSNLSAFKWCWSHGWYDFLLKWMIVNFSAWTFISHLTHHSSNTIKLSPSPTTSPQTEKCNNLGRSSFNYITNPVWIVIITEGTTHNFVWDQYSQRSSYSVYLSSLPPLKLATRYKTNNFNWNFLLTPYILQHLHNVSLHTLS